MIPLVISAKNPQKIVDGNNLFAFKLYNEINSSNDKNLFYSPFSISTALAMTYAGARGETALQMSRTMEFPQGKKFTDDYKNLMDRLIQGAEGKIKLNIANGLWAQKDFQFLDSFISLARSAYKSELKNVDFTDNIKRETARKDINEWVAKKTNDKIKDLLNPGDISESSRLVLVNAVYFYGEWANPFKGTATFPNNFSLLNDTLVTVPFMNQHGSFNYYEDPKIQAIEIPYKGNKASMVIFLPSSKNGITDVEKSFDYKYYLGIIGSFQTRDVQLSLPKFQTTFRIYLANSLSKMGMPLAFSPGGADFSGMTGKRNLFISSVIHQAFIAVDELGTEAAAATATGMAGSARPSSDMKIFNADHPFIFLIKDNTTGSILFMGKITNPGIPR